MAWIPPTLTGVLYRFALRPHILAPEHTHPEHESHASMMVTTTAGGGERVGYTA